MSVQLDRDTAHAVVDRAVDAPSVDDPAPSAEESANGALSGGRLPRLLDRIWNDRRLAIGTTVAVTVVWAISAARWTPRGPVTTGQAMWSIVLSVAVGVLVGIASRSRWMMLATPVLFATVFEVVRLGTDGPTVDGLRASTYGLMAFVVGRGFHALVSLLPLIWASAIGAGIARHVVDTQPRAAPRSPRRVAATARRAVAVVAGLGLLLFSVVLLRPASTDAIVDDAGRRVPGSVAELTTVDVNGHDLSMMIRGHDTDNPVLLYLAGGPGGSELGAMRNHLPDLEEHFTVVTWDQRGAGKSYVELDPTSTITPENMVADTIAVTDYLRDRFGQDRIYLLGQSWGSLLGVLASQQTPDRYVALIGVGQMVSVSETDRIFYEDTLDWARSSGKDALVDELVAIGPPPYDSILDYETALSHEHEVYPYDHSPNAEGEGGFSENFLVSEYSLIEQVHMLAAFMETFSALYPQLQDIDLRDTASELDVPVFFVQGAHEADGRAEPFADWYEMLRAPSKHLVTLDTSGHRPLFEQPDAFVAYMVDTVLTETTP